MGSNKYAHCGGRGGGGRGKRETPLLPSRRKRGRR